MPTDFERVVDIVSQVLGVNKRQVHPETDLLRDLGADAIDRMELRYELEEEFAIPISEEAVQSLRTIEEALALVQESSSS